MQALGVMPPKHVIPVIFVPGIMGTNLRANSKLEKEGTPAWVPPNSIWAGLGEWRRRKSQAPWQRQIEMAAERVEVDDGGPVSVPKTLFTLTEAEAKRRDWGEVHTLDNFGVAFWCQVNHDFDNAAETYGASWDSSRKIWKPHYENLHDKEALSPVVKNYKLKSRNAVGFLRTTDQINGEEDLRVRFYSFCLFHGAAAVCGSGQSMKLEEPKGDYLPFIFHILRSVSFIDDQNGKTNQ